MKKSHLLGITILVLIAIVFISYIGPSGMASAANKGEILIGCLQDTTGVTSILGKMIESGAKWAVDEINSQGGIKGRKVKLVSYDTKGEVQEAISAFTRMVTKDKVSAIIGPPVANIGIAIAPISEQYNVPVLGFAMDNRATIKGNGQPYKNMFLLQPSSDQQGDIMAHYAVREKQFKNFGIIYNQSNAYSLSLVEAFKRTLKGLNGASIKAEVPYQANDKDFKTLLSKINSAKVDVIYAPNYPQELVLIVQQARAIGYDGPIICGLDAAPPFLDLTGPEANGVVYINNITDNDPKVQEISREYKEKNRNNPTNKFFLGYDVIGALTQIIGKVGDNPIKIQKAVENLKAYPGVTGDITINPKTHQTKGLSMYMHEIKDQKNTFIKKYSVPEK